MVVDEYSSIQISRSNKVKLDDFKLAKRESYNYVLDDLIEFGEENNFRSIRIQNLTKKMEMEDDRKIKTKPKASSQIG